MVSTTPLGRWLNRSGMTLLPLGQEFLQFLLQTADDLGRLGGGIGPSALVGIVARVQRLPIVGDFAR